MSARMGWRQRLRHRRLANRLQRDLTGHGDPRLSVTAAMNAAGLSTTLTRWPLDTAESELRTLVKRLAGDGALDEGSGDSLDRLIDNWLQEHLSSLHLLHLQRAGIADQLQAEARGRLHASERHQGLIDGRIRLYDRALGSAQTGLLGPEHESVLQSAHNGLRDTVRNGGRDKSRTSGPNGGPNGERDSPWSPARDQGSDAAHRESSIPVPRSPRTSQEEVSGG